MTPQHWTDILQSLAIIGLGATLIYISRAIRSYHRSNQLVMERMDSVSEEMRVMTALLERQ